MQQLLDFLFGNPILLLLLLGPLLSGVGAVLQKAAKRAEESRRREQGGGRKVEPTVPPSQAQPRRVSQPERQTPPLRPQRPEPRRATPAEAAEELRRLLGGDAEPKPDPVPPPRTPPRRTTVGAPIEALPSARDTQQLPEFRQLDHLAKRPDSTVGQGMASRRGPMSGAVGARELGTVGGRVSKARRAGRRGRGHRDLVKTHELPAMILAQEILGRPLGLRERNDF